MENIIIDMIGTQQRSWRKPDTRTYVVAFCGEASWRCGIIVTEMPSLKRGMTLESAFVDRGSAEISPYAMYSLSYLVFLARRRNQCSTYAGKQEGRVLWNHKSQKKFKGLRWKNFTTYLSSSTNKISWLWTTINYNSKWKGQRLIWMIIHPTLLRQTSLTSQCGFQKYQAHQLLCMANSMLSYRKAKTWEKEKDIDTSWNFMSMGLAVYLKQTLYLLK